MVKKISIALIEQICKHGVKKNAVSIGVDVAQYNTGICFLTTDSKNIYIQEYKKITLKKQKDVTLYEHIDEFLKQAIEIRTGLLEAEWFKGKTPVYLAIEDCWFGRNVWTLKVLARFFLLIYLVFRKTATEVLPPIQPVTGRKKIQFVNNKKIKDNVKLQLKDYLYASFGLKFDDDDLADAFVLALYGVLK